MSKKGIFSTDSKAQLRHERSKRFAVSMMIKKDMEEKERERQRFERQLERNPGQQHLLFKRKVIK